MDLAKNLMEGFEDKLKVRDYRFEDKLQAHDDRFENKFKAWEDKLLEGIEAKLVGYSALVPPSPGQEERDELGPMGDFSHSPLTTPIHGSTSTMLDMSQQAALHVLDMYGQEHG